MYISFYRGWRNRSIVWSFVRRGGRTVWRFHLTDIVSQFLDIRSDFLPIGSLLNCTSKIYNKIQLGKNTFLGRYLVFGVKSNTTVTSAFELKNQEAHFNPRIGRIKPPSTLFFVCVLCLSFYFGSLAVFGANLSFLFTLCRRRRHPLK